MTLAQHLRAAVQTANRVHDDINHRNAAKHFARGDYGDHQEALDAETCEVPEVSDADVLASLENGRRFARSVRAFAHKHGAGWRPEVLAGHLKFADALDEHYRDLNAEVVALDESVFRSGY